MSQPEVCGTWRETSDVRLVKYLFLASLNYGLYWVELKDDYER
jgi:hypothetical protein